ncbi:Spt4 transcription elongation protein [Spraguea lophii 42_110]|uniref:Transcription elongation factor SPT4 n=1 Tax=Spraguea lophii (strain 42_110) TaxID=1358809 RepID=S7WDF0_SPRLO|nr:Spt4 transcription elongation protein [Spraguea lophii 42_110]
MADKKKTRIKLRACMGCSIIQRAGEFKAHGCPNCSKYISLRRSDEFVNNCLGNFSGMIAMIKNDDSSKTGRSRGRKSWVAKWQRINGFDNGLYAITVDGVLPNKYVQQLEQKGRQYYNRENTFKLNE